MLPVIASPVTRPAYSVDPTVKLIKSPRSFPLTGVDAPFAVNVPEIIWNSCFSASSPCGSFQVPSTFAGTIHNSDVHQLTQSPAIVSLSSAAQPSGANVLPTIRVPGLSARNLG